MSTPCTPAPPRPPNGSSDWTARVQGNCFTNIQRLGQWIGGNTQVASGEDPSQYFQNVTAGSLGGGSNPGTIYVLAHGWAPGYRQAVTNAGGNLLWWGADASVKGIWTSDWAWSPVTGVIVPLPVNTTGVLQSIFGFDSSAVILAYSWIDDSATDSGDLNLEEVYGSEAYTHVNGMRLANALEQAIAPSFWTAPNALLRLIGHSHGSRVATVAALSLQQSGRRVAHLTILDSPESDSPLDVNGANLLGFYLEQMQITNPSTGYGGGPFVDNYASYFGVSYSGTSNLQNVVEVALDPSKLYHFDDASGQHSYAAAWYGGAAAGAASQSEPPLGVDWPPPQSPFLPALDQNWPTGTNQFGQWNLQAGSTIHDAFSYTTEQLAVSTVGTQGNVQVSSTGTVTFGPASGSWPAYSIFKGSYANPSSGEGYGVAFDMVWTAPQVGDYFVVTMEARGLFGEQEVLLVMDGQSFPGGQTSVAINDGASGSSLSMYMYFAAAPGNTYGQISVANFRLVEINDASGYLKVKRLAEVADRAASRALRAPKR